MRISKKERVEAIEQLERFADVWIAGVKSSEVPDYAEDSLCCMAHAAQDAVSTLPHALPWEEIGSSWIYAHVYLEAAALLRDGWEPGETLERLR